MSGKSTQEVGSALRGGGYTVAPSSPELSGIIPAGEVWTKDLGNGFTFVVRIDEGSGVIGRADEFPHSHKEAVPSSFVKNGNFNHFSAPVFRFDDSGEKSFLGNYKKNHIPIGGAYSGPACLLPIFDIDHLPASYDISTENPARILPYAQGVFVQACRGKATHSVPEYLNNPTLLEELKKTTDLSEACATYWGFSRAFGKKRHSFSEKQENNEALTEKEFITEGDVIRLVDCAVLAILTGDIEGFTSVGCEMEVLKDKGFSEQYRFAQWYLSEIKKYVTNEMVKLYLDGL